jgi:hypothetical protein
MEPPQHMNPFEHGDLSVRYCTEEPGRRRLATTIASRRSLRAGFSQQALRRSIVEMIGPPVVTGREFEQLPPCAGETALAGQFAEPVGHFSIMLPVERQSTVP